MSWRAVLAVPVCVAILCSGANAQDAQYFGKAPPPSEVTTRVDRGVGTMFTDARRLEGPMAAREVDHQIRQMLESKFKSQAATRSLNLQVTTSDQEPAARKIGQKWFANYGVAVENIPLSEASQISAIAAEDGSSAFVSERNMPKSLNFDAQKLGVAAAKVPLDIAVKSAVEEVSKLISQQRSLVPSVGEFRKKSDRLVVWVDPGSGVGKLAWAVRLEAEDAKGASHFGVDVWVDALGGKDRPEVFEIKRLVHQEHAGSVRAVVWDPTPVEPARTHALSLVQVVRSAGAASESSDIAVTDNSGQFRFQSGTGAQRFEVRLANRFFVVRNAQGQLIEVAGTGTDRQPIELRYTSTREFDIAQPSAFYWANRARDFVSEALGTNTLLNVELLVNFDAACNSSYNIDRRRITLYRASRPGSGTCINRAGLYTIFHEFGHAVDQAFGGIQNSPDGDAYSEGFGDSLAILFTGSSCYGPHNDAPNTCYRDAANPPALYPSNGFGIHHRGRIYSGFTWELMQRLSAVLPRDEALALAKLRTLQVAAANPSGFARAVEMMLLADDNDDDLGNGTPHSKQIVAAAKARNIPLPAGLPE